MKMEDKYRGMTDRERRWQEQHPLMSEEEKLRLDEQMEAYEAWKERQSVYGMGVGVRTDDDFKI